MIINWPAFTPFTALLGGILIGGAASVLALSLGRIAGISGIIGMLLPSRHNSHPGNPNAWRWAFIMGLVLAGSLIPTIAPMVSPPVLTLSAFGQPIWVVITAGLLVGFGARLGGGCTSGHGVCGLARLSPRSGVAVGVFMTAAFLTHYCIQ
ncbi:YeeE/YedE family protein [Parvibium lacunae]|uniref:YeeE/YedE family protein n=2 Tax=Parvibium lacunae TaxID=1888893 RepID=A0A368L3J6_9BURK|nr:YeeE/YedE family protein [Parvibium lacunae]RCS58161.1 YeeE/YedE family protein [Parvibium lacunae]